MKKKFINGLLLLAVASMSCSTFTSCKDDVNDLETEVKQSDAELKNLIAALQEAQKKCQEECTKKFEEIEKALSGKASAADLKTLKDAYEKHIKDFFSDGHKTWTREEIVNVLKETLKTSNVDLSQLTTENIKKITDQLTSVANAVNGVEGKGGLVERVTELEELVEKLSTGESGLSKEEVEKLIGVAKSELQQQIKTLENTLNVKLDGLTDSVSSINATITTINQTVTTINGQLKAVEEEAVKALALAKTNQADIANQKELLEAAIERIAANEEALAELSGILDRVTTLEGQIGDIVTDITSLKTKDQELEDKITKLGEDLGKYALDLDALTERVTANEAAISALQIELNKLQNRVDALVTGIIVQGVYNPLFGTFSLPIGVQSNMLVNYYGTTDKPTYSFPSVQKLASVDNENELNQDEYDVLVASGIEPYTVENGALLMNDNAGNLGKVFVTINPNNVNFEGRTIELVNSQDKASKVELRNLRRSEEELTFGYSARSTANNGFYEADATLPATFEAVNPTALHIDSNLKSAVKDILKDRRSNLRSNVIHLMKAVYDQINGMLPAYGIKAAWTVNNEPFAVYSNYNIAATTFKPLSFGFMYDQSLRKLPIIDPISQSILDLNLNPEDYKFDFSDVKLNLNSDGITFEFSLTPISISYEGTLGVTTTVKFIVEGNIYGAEGTENAGKIIGTFKKDMEVPVNANVPEEQLQDLLGQIANSVNGTLEDLDTNVKAAFDKAIGQMLEKVNAAVDKMIADMQIKINDKIGSLIENIQNELYNKAGSYIDKFNGVISRYNNLAKRLNNILEDPNHYLQPTMFYKAGNGGDYFLSNNPANPTVLVKDGGDAFMAYATTYTAEVVAPSFKKVVAITDVIDNATGLSVAGATAKCAAINKSAKFLAEVCPGFQKRFAIPTKDMEAGKTYEILYTAVDYQGVTATARYYVTVK